MKRHLNVSNFIAASPKLASLANTSMNDKNSTIIYIPFNARSIVHSTDYVYMSWTFTCSFQINFYYESQVLFYFFVWKYFLFNAIKLPFVLRNSIPWSKITRYQFKKENLGNNFFNTKTSWHHLSLKTIYPWKEEI